MIADVLGAASNSTVLNISLTIVALMAFLGVVIWAFRIKKQDITAMSRIPLDEDDETEDRGVMNGRT